MIGQINNNIYCVLLIEEVPYVIFHIHDLIYFKGSVSFYVYVYWIILTVTLWLFCCVGDTLAYMISKLFFLKKKGDEAIDKAANTSR